MRVPLATVILSERLVLVNKINVKRVSFYQIEKRSSIKKSVRQPFKKNIGLKNKVQNEEPEGVSLANRILR